MNRSRCKAIGGFAMAVLLLAGAFVAARPSSEAYADDDMTALNARVEETTVRYKEAQQAIEDIEQRIGETQTRIDELEVQIDAKREESAQAMCSIYRYSRSTPMLINLVFSTDSVHELYGTLDYLTRTQSHNIEIMQQQADAKVELEETFEQLASDKVEAEEAAAEAEAAMQEAQDVRQQAMEEAAAAAAAQIEAQKRHQAQVQAQHETVDGSMSPMAEGDIPNDSANTESSLAGVVESEIAVASGSVAPGDVSWQSPRDEFIASWGARINNYLAGSPLAGYGPLFAQSAWDYGVDPRWSPAISCVESGKGRACFRPYNAWGWMSRTGWSSWEQSIPAHVSGLARLYGYTLTLEGAAMYCPGTHVEWYNRCLEEMNKI